MDSPKCRDFLRDTKQLRQLPNFFKNICVTTGVGGTFKGRDLTSQ